MSSARQLSCSVLVLRCLSPQLADDTAEAFRDEALAAVERSRPEALVLDLSGVKYLSSAGITPLLDVEGVLVASRLISSGEPMAAAFEHQPDVAAAVASLA